MSDESKFKDDEIERLRRQMLSKRVHVDYDQLKARRDLIVSARTDFPEDFQARVKGYGIDLNSERGKTIMQAYWAIRREPPR